jgi:hypothetical protein
MAEYPESITPNPGSDEYNFLFKHSHVFRELHDWQGPIELSADLLFGGDQTKWQDFVDIFFPEVGVKPYFGKKNNNIYVLPNRGNEESLKDMLEFLMIDSPDTIMNFAKAQARTQFILSGSLTVPRGVGIRKARVATVNNNNNNYYFANNNNLFPNNEEEVVNTRPEIRVNNNEGNNYENYEEENQEENLVQTSRARGPLLNFSQLLNTAKAKKSTKGGLRKKHRTQRRRRTHKK